MKTTTLPPQVNQARALLDEHPHALADLAQAVGWSPSHLQRTFRLHLGLSPAEYTRARKQQSLRHHLVSMSVTRAIVESDHGSPSRVYERTHHWGMTPGAYAKGAGGIEIAWAVVATVLGPALVAANTHGLCALLLGVEHAHAEVALKREFPRATLLECNDGMHAFLAPCVSKVADYLAGLPCELPVHVMGTAFQVRVWQALMATRPGETLSYSELAQRAGSPQGHRAAASACARNRLGVVVPCHRVVPADGTMGGYRWGWPLKQSLLEREGSKPGLGL